MHHVVNKELASGSEKVSFPDGGQGMQFRRWRRGRSGGAAPQGAAAMPAPAHVAGVHAAGAHAAGPMACGFPHLTQAARLPVPQQFWHLIAPVPWQTGQGWQPVEEQ